MQRASSTTDLLPQGNPLVPTLSLNTVREAGWGNEMALGYNLSIWDVWRKRLEEGMLREVIHSAIVFNNSLSQKGFAMPIYYSTDTTGSRMVHGYLKLWDNQWLCQAPCARRQEGRVDCRSSKQTSICILQQPSPSPPGPLSFLLSLDHRKVPAQAAFRAGL